MNEEIGRSREPTLSLERDADQELVVWDLVGLFWRRWPLMFAVGLLVVLVAGVYLWRASPMYESRALILTASSDQGGTVELPSLLLGHLAGIGGQSLQTEAEVIKSPLVLGKALESLDPELRAQVPEDLTEALDARQYKSTDIIEVVAVCGSKRAATALADAVAQHYLTYRDERSREQLRSVVGYLDEKIDEVRRDLLNAQEALREFKLQHHTLDLQAEAQALVNRAASMDLEVRRAEAQLAAARAELAAARQGEVYAEGERVAARDIAETPTVVELKRQLVALEAKRAELAQEYTSTSPEVVALDRQLQEARTRLQAEAAKAVAAAVAPRQAQVWAGEAQLQALRNAAGAVRAEMSSLPDKEFQLAQLQVQVQVLTQAYQMLNEQYQKLRISQEGQIGKARILAAATVPEAPVRPRKKMVLALALFMGALLGLGVALTVDYLDDRVKSEDEVCRITGLPVLARLWRVRRGQEARLEHLPEGSWLRETFRTLRSNIALSDPAGPPRLLVVSAPVAGGDKSMIAANLAVAFAFDGKSTLLVDADLRQPVQHQRFGASGEAGLTSVLLDGAEVDQVLQATDVDGLRVLSAGPPAPHPTELLGSERCRELLRRLPDYADVVVVDTPPVGLFADAQLVATAADATLLVVPMLQATTGAVAESLKLFTLVRAHVCGTVLTGIARGVRAVTPARRF